MFPITATGPNSVVNHSVGMILCFAGTHTVVVTVGAALDLLCLDTKQWRYMICFALIQSSESITANEITALTDVTDDFLIWMKLLQYLLCLDTKQWRYMICFALIQSSESITANEITALTDVTDDFLIWMKLLQTTGLIAYSICFAFIQSSEGITANEITALTDVTDDFLDCLSLIPYLDYKVCIANYSKIIGNSGKKTSPQRNSSQWQRTHNFSAQSVWPFQSP